MSPFRPMKRRDYEAWIRQYGWKLVKAGSGDYKVLDENDRMVLRFVKVTHPGNEVVPFSIQETRNALKTRGRDYEA